MLIGREVRRHIQMNCSPVPPLRHYAGPAKSDARSTASCGQQRTELRGNARARLVLKNARLDHVFQERGIGDADRTNTFGQRLCRALQDQLPPICKAEIENGVGHRLGWPGAYRPDGLKFDLDFPQVGDCCVRSVERPVGRRRRRHEEHSDAHNHPDCNMLGLAGARLRRNRSAPAPGYLRAPTLWHLTRS